MDQRRIPPPSSFEVTFIKRVILKAHERLRRGFVDEWAGANELDHFVDAIGHEGSPSGEAYARADHAGKECKA